MSGSEKTARVPSDERLLETPSSLRAVVEEGPDCGMDLPLAAARVERLIIGTSPVANLRLTDRHVSRRHAAFEVRQGRLQVTDLESTNGTLLDGVAITGAFVRRGQVLRLGETSVRILAAETSREVPLSMATGFGRVLGASPRMRCLYPLCERLAHTTIPLIIEGETGTGKEVMAEAIHEQGDRAQGPYVVFDCTAVPPNLVESELFGHEKGAFTGAVSARKGVFEQADGGTLLIDEIGDLDLALQPKLLRAIERSEIRRVGGNQVIRTDVRVLAATRRDLDREIEAGRFRDDLYHRLAVARLELPALRHRAGDVRLLAQVFWRDLGGDPRALPAEVLARWEKAPWPGNVRELRNAVVRHFALGQLEVPSTRSADPSGAPPEARDDLLGAWVAAAMAAGDSFQLARSKLADAFEHQYLAALLERHGGDTAKAAAAAGVGRRYLQMLLAKRKPAKD